MDTTIIAAAREIAVSDHLGNIRHIAEHTTPGMVLAVARKLFPEGAVQEAIAQGATGADLLDALNEV